MGLEETTEGSRTTFLTLYKGVWAKKVDKDTEGAKERKNKKEVTIYEKHYKTVSGTIKSIKIEKKDFGKQLQIEMSDVDETYTLSIPVESRYFDAFCAKIGHADLSRPISIAPYSFIPSGETHEKSGLNIYQHDNDKAVDEKGKLPYFFTQEEPKGKPQPDKTNAEMDSDSWKVYFMQVTIFYQKYILALMGGNPKTEAKPVRQNKAGKKAAETLAATPDDDLPF